MATKKRARAPRSRPPGRRQPETLRLRNITPSFTATDLQRSIAFYRDVLGFMIGEEWRENGQLAGCEILAGAVTIMLSQDDFAKGRDRQKGVGMRWRCQTAQDIDKLAAEIKARGGVLEQEPQDMPWGERVFMISDPDGFKLTFVQSK
jgi:lactoylglutathione lyase